jgi:hypothetical protein
MNDDNLSAGRSTMRPGMDFVTRPATLTLAPDMRDVDSVRTALDALLESPRFRSSAQLGRFLRYVATESLAGRGEQIKAYSIATSALGRGEDFDPQTDPIVRVEATRLRGLLAGYYSEEGRNDALRFRLAPGSYRPQVEFRAGGLIARDPRSGQAAAPMQPHAARQPSQRLHVALVVLLTLNILALGALMVAFARQSDDHQILMEMIGRMPPPPQGDTTAPPPGR